MRMTGRGPDWIRALSDREAHAIAFRLRYESMEGVLSERQEWLWDRLVEELEWRREHRTWPDRRCSCEICFDPGPFD